MKNLLFLTIAAFVIFMSINCYSKPEQPQVKGGFKSFTVTEYRFIDGKINPKSASISFESIFDEKGNQIEMITYDGNKEDRKIIIKNKYNSENLIVEAAYCDESGNMMTKFTYGYDKNFNKIADTTYDAAGNVTQRGYYKYDKNNFLIEEIHEFKTDGDNFASGTTHYKNDAKGNKIEESAIHSISASVEVTASADLENNNSNAEVSTSVNSTEGEPDIVTYEYEYDDKDNIIKYIRHGIGGTKLIYAYKYDKFGNIIEQISFDEEGTPVLKTVFEYSK